MNIFDFRKNLIGDYRRYVESFLRVCDPRILKTVAETLDQEILWPDPLLQLNPTFASAGSVGDLVASGDLHPECERIFRRGKLEDGSSWGTPIRLYRHQADAVAIAAKRQSYVLTTGTGSGKSLGYIAPIVDRCLRMNLSRSAKNRIKAIVVYPLNALANSQFGELKKFLTNGYGSGSEPVRYARYTGQESDAERHRIAEAPPDVLLTNYMMLELLLTRAGARGADREIVKSAVGLEFLVFDELHAYRGRQGADVAMLIRRVRNRLESPNLQCVGTSATLAGENGSDDPRREVAERASRLFGVEIRPDAIIGETLERFTAPFDADDPAFVAALTEAVRAPSGAAPASLTELKENPVLQWLEATVGVREAPSGRLVRCRPISVSGSGGAAERLSQTVNIEKSLCAAAIERELTRTFQTASDSASGARPFAFRLHQFISRGDTVYASLEPEARRLLTTTGQRFTPSDRSRILLPLAFCRECGKEYYVVWKTKDAATGGVRFTARDLTDRTSDGENESGFLYLSVDRPWPMVESEQAERSPSDWTEMRGESCVVKRDARERMPQSVHVGTDGAERADGLSMHFVRAPFRFCLHCGVSYPARQYSDFAKLTTLGSEGRSTATTILTLFAIRRLRGEADVPAEAKKILSFTDNRQDASLQAGHFNDFVETGLLRAALCASLDAAGSAGLMHDELTQRVFAALDLPPDLYATSPTARFQEKISAERALRDVLGYRLYCDLRRGWRVTSPNLEQCGLLTIEYESLSDLCVADDLWSNRHPALASSDAVTRECVTRTLLDLLRKSLAIKVEYLDSQAQDRIRQRSDQHLKHPWALDENEATRLTYASIAFPGPATPKTERSHLFISSRSRFGQYLRRRETLPHWTEKLKTDDCQTLINELLEILCDGGLVERVMSPAKGRPAGYQLKAAAMKWKSGDGTAPVRDPLATPNESEARAQPNSFFVEFYKRVARDLGRVEAREHTAQVSSEKREERERQFRSAELPVLYCSPTMELGIDIADLSVVNLRNVPPTPANYAQRSGRAGRGGQPALVVSYCTTGSAHDQYFFKRQDHMVAGVVQPPKIDLVNEELLKTHLHAVWLAESNVSLGRSLTDVLQVGGERPTLNPNEMIAAALTDPQARARARARFLEIVQTLWDSQDAPDWFTEDWLDRTLAAIPREFDRACDRWRGLYRAAQAQREIQHRILGDASRNHREKKIAEKLRFEAETQLALLESAEDLRQSDFYSYRYFAAEGFLPGYNFPRLPVAAYIPARRGFKEETEYLSRPRFLGISEFGPRAVVYHEGSRYVIERAILPVRESEAGGELPTGRAKQCGQCGYMHPIANSSNPDVCERCGARLENSFTGLLRLQNVQTRRRDKISSDEEERMRLGYELTTGVRFSERDHRPDCRVAVVEANGERIATLTYGERAVIWRVNLGWRRRKNKAQYGFCIDAYTGQWAKNEIDPNDDADEDLSLKKGVTERVIPYVEDYRNCLLLEFPEPPKPETVASLQAALRRGIQACFQLEENELAVEPLPDVDRRRLILFYEATEGGAGVLKQLLDDPTALRRVARDALTVCHYDSATGADLRRAPHGREDCEAACYDCLLSYDNQPDHPSLDRHLAAPFLTALLTAKVFVSPTAQAPHDHVAALKRKCDSTLERDWLEFALAGGHRPPSHAQILIASCGTRPDFLYEAERAAIYVDGPHHEFPERRERDRIQSECLEDGGWTVIRFGVREDWKVIFAKYPSVFGRGKKD